MQDMTLAELKQYRYAVFHSRTLADRIKGLEEAAASGAAGKAAADLARLKKQLERERADMLGLRLRIERWINTVPDLQMRDILYFRHVRCMSWIAIARRIGGGNNELNVRAKHSRFWRAKDSGSE